MPDYPTPGVLPLFINNSTRWGFFLEFPVATNPTVALTWGAANKALYMPFWLPWSYPVRRVFWQNGSSVTSANADFGIYTADGTKIYSTGSTAMSGANVLQYVTPTEFVLSPGRYYMAIAMSSTTAGRGGTGYSGLNIARMAMAGLLEETSALPLPATMTPVTVVSTVIPFCGFTRTATGF